ncbi:MAG: hypothetical protein ACK5LO_05905 [Leucobacter sp.]
MKKRYGVAVAGAACLVLIGVLSLPAIVNPVEDDSREPIEESQVQEVAHDWNAQATESAEEIRDALSTGPDPIFGNIRIDNNAEKLVLHVKADPSPEQRDLVESLANGIPVEYVSGSVLSTEESIEIIEALYDHVDPERKKFGGIGANEAGTVIELAVWTAPDAEQTAQQVREFLEPYGVGVEIDIMDAPDPTGTLYSGSRIDLNGREITEEAR